MSTPFPDNSDKSKNPETNYNKVKSSPQAADEAPDLDSSRPKVGRIVSEDHKAIRRNTPLGTKVKNFFFGDSAHNILEYVVLEVLIPAAKEAAADAVTQGVEKRLFGDVRSVSRRTGTRPGGGLSSNASGAKVHYDRMAHAARQPAASGGVLRRGGRHDIGQVIIPTRAEATEIIEMMYNIISQYEVVTVAEVLEMAGERAEYTDRNFGWSNLRGAQPVRVREGYLLNLPTPEPLER